MMAKTSSATITLSKRPEANGVALCASVSQFEKPGMVMIIRNLPLAAVKF